MAQNTSKNLRNQIIYSIYVRNYSGEGTFAAVERDLERIREHASGFPIAGGPDS